MIVAGTGVEVIKSPCQGTLVSGAPCPSPAKSGQNFCGRCIRKELGLTNRPTKVPGQPTVQIRDQRELESRKLLHELITQNNVDVHLSDDGEEFNVFEALLRVAEEQETWKNICLAKLAKLHEDEWRWDGDRAGEQIRSEILMYERAVDRATNTLIKIGRLGIEDKLMRIAERQAQVVEQAIVRTFAELGLDPDMQAAARKRIVAHLMNS